MKTTVKIVYIISSLFFLVYLLLPSQKFPFAPLDALQSNEPADIETPLRKAYFTNYNRAEVMDNYYRQLTGENFLSRYFTFRLNYPPEEAQTIIRDQTRSSYLEEIVHPFRESVFINGFIPKEQKDSIFIDGKTWFQKLTIRFVPSNIWIRALVGLTVLALIPMLFHEYKIALNDLKTVIFGKRKL